MTLKEALFKSIKATAKIDDTTIYSAERDGNWIKIIRTLYDKKGNSFQVNYDSFYGLDNPNLPSIVLNNLVWEPENQK